MTARPLLAPRSLGALLLCLLACFAVSAAGGAITAGPVKSWYPHLVKPPLTPPDIAFPIVWTLLYAMMAIAAWLVWQAGRDGKGRDIALFGLQLAFNLGWSILFFGLQQPGLALIEIALLWLAIAATIVVFRRHSAVAAALLLPYLAWVSFAVYLNAGIWWLNPT